VVSQSPVSLPHHGNERGTRGFYASTDSDSHGDDAGWGRWKEEGSYGLLAEVPEISQFTVLLGDETC